MTWCKPTKSLFAILLLFYALTACRNSEVAKTDWSGYDSILQKIKPPSFLDTSFNIEKYGAKNGGKQDCLPAISKAILDCSNAGGGSVIVPAGKWFVKGPIRLLNDVNLHLADSATILFSTDDNDYLPVVFTRFEGVELMNYSPLVYADHQQNIALTGNGTLDGGADNNHWWNWVGAARFGWKEGMPKQHDAENEPALMKMAATDVPASKRVFGKGHCLRPSFVEFYNCENVLIQGVTLINSPFWILHPTLCKNVTVDGVITNSLGPNNDGCDPESCENVMIKNCSFTDGDDCIAIKSGRDRDGRRVNIPCKNIIVQDCQMKDGHGGVVIGSETSGGIENVYAQNCVMNSANLDRAIRIKSNACRGGELKNFYFRNIKVGEVREAVVKVNMVYGNESGNDCRYPPLVQNVHVDSVTSEKSQYAVYIEGLADKPAAGIYINHCRFAGVEKNNVINNAENVNIKTTTINGEQVDVNDQ